MRTNRSGFGPTGLVALIAGVLAAGGAATRSVLPFTASSIPFSHGPMVIAVGEASHGDAAMLSARNSLIHELAEAGDISILALETGYAEALYLDNFVRGGPGNASEVAAKGFTSGFGTFAGNVALLKDLRAINARKRPGKRIGIIGIDLSLGGPLGSAPTMAPVECALDGVPDRALREGLRASFAQAVMPGLTQAVVPAETKTLFHELTRKLTSSIDHDASEHVRQCASIVTESAAVLDALPKAPGDDGMPQDAWRAISKRDAAMAANALTAFARADGRSILLFAHTSHILNAPMLGGRFSTQQQPPQSMGQTMRRSLGSRYLIIAQVQSASSPPSKAVPDLLDLLHPACGQPCMIPADQSQARQACVGINGDDQEIIDAATAANFYLIVPKRG